MRQAGISGLAERSIMASGKRKSTMAEQQKVKMPKMEEAKGVHETMRDRGKMKHPTMTDAVYHLGFAKTNSST